MRTLAAPYVFQCAWRSFWPEIYNYRICFWDTPLNSVFIGRALATIGEITWIMQLALGLMYCAREIKKHDEDKANHLNIDNKAISAVFLCAIAEFFCNHAMIVGNYFLNVIEASLWTIALGILIPDAIRLIVRSKTIFKNDDKIDASQIDKFLGCFIVMSTFFVAEVSIDYIPSQYKLW
jgi:hypothetical protein